MSAHEPTGHALPPPLPASAPPTTPGALLPQKSVWPQYLGIVSLFIGLTGATLHGASLAMYAVTGPKRYRGTIDGLSVDTARWCIDMQNFYDQIHGTNSLLCSLLLIVAAVLLLRRKHACLRLYRIWIPLRCLTAVGTTTFYAYIHDVPLREMHENGVNMALGTNTRMYAFAFMFAVLLFQCSYPLFVLWFLRRPSIRATFNTPR
jgi:hypothetical protein